MEMVCPCLYRTRSYAEHTDGCLRRYLVTITCKQNVQVTGFHAERQYRTVEIQLPGAAFFVRLFPGLLLRFQFEIHMININGSSFISIPLLSADGCISALLQIG